MRKKNIFLLFVLLGSKMLTAQVGVGTINTQGALHIDGARDNAATGVPTATQQRNDVIITAAGKVGIGTIAPANSAGLEINSTTMGFLPSRMTSAQMKAIATTPQSEGLVVFCTDCNPQKGIRVFNGTTWVDATGSEDYFKGSYFSTISNGASEFFNNTTACMDKAISVSVSCPATVTGPSNTIYNTVSINGQCWMASNLKELPTVPAPCTAAINTGCNAWLATTIADLGRWGYYNTATTTGTAGWATIEPATGEGLLYQWNATMLGIYTERTRGVCPSGWHVPSDCEFFYLEFSLGMTIDQSTTTGWRTAGNVGGKLGTFTRATSGSANGTGNNSSGFSARSSGVRNANGTFSGRGASTSFHTSTASGTSNVIVRSLSQDQNGVGRSVVSRAIASAVRCLKDN
jgi:uncharacterized protein (TIGR02145 family)